MDLTAEIHKAIEKYNVSGAQHGTSGNSSQRLKKIAGQTRTTKANVATALQMISWGLKVNDYGNARLDEAGDFIKLKDEGVTEEMWTKMSEYAQAQGLKKGDYKKLNLPFENSLLAQARSVRQRMVKAVEDFAYNLIANVLNSSNTAPLAIEAMLEAGSFDAGVKAERLEDPAEWRADKIAERAAAIDRDRGPEGDFED